MEEWMERHIITLTTDVKDKALQGIKISYILKT